MGRNKLGLWVAGVCAVVLLVSFGYGLGRRAAARAYQSQSTVAPAGAPLPTIEIEPIQPSQELAAINASSGGGYRLNGSDPASGPGPLSRQPSTLGQAPGSDAESGLGPSSRQPSALGQAPGSDPATPGPGAPYPTEDSDRVREIQRALKLAGFNPGPIDGKLGPRTRGAIKDFQTAKGLAADGKVGPNTWRKLELYLEGSREQ